MGFMGLLKFALLCINFLAWPVVALGYPLFASIKAIETGSKYHMKKLVIYWTLFSLISLFEFAFVKILEWIPFWSNLKLIAIFWLAIPRFHGACYAYQSYIRPFLVVNLQQVISRFEEQLRTKETFLDDVADTYTKENGFEASENLIATERKCKELDISQRDVTESDEKNDASTSKQLKEPVAARKDDEILEVSDKSAGTDEAKQVQPVTKETTYAAVVTKGISITPTQTLILENKQPPTPPPLKKVGQPEWTCPLCQVTTTCENNLNDHLRGKKHKSMCDSLKSIKLNARDIRSSGSSTGLKDGSKQKSCRKSEERVGNQDSAATHHLCFLCNVKLVGDASLASHLRGKRHSSNVERKWGKVEGVVS